MIISVKSNIDEVRRTLNAMEREALPRAMASAINRTGQQMETHGVRLVAKIMGVRQASVRQRIVRRLARRGEPTLVIDCYGNRVNIASFRGTRQTKRGVSSSAFGKRRVYPRVFLIRGGAVAVKRIGKGRKPLRPVFGPGIKSEFERNRVEIENVARQRFDKNMDDALRAALKGYIK